MSGGLRVSISGQGFHFYIISKNNSNCIHIKTQNPPECKNPRLYLDGKCFDLDVLSSLALCPQGADPLMALAYGAVTQLGLFSQQYPPPLLPKPGKDNVRLQKLLKRTAKKKPSPQGSQSAAHFRSSLSPVDEASPDLEHSDHSTPPKTPETPFRLYSPQQPPRIAVRPLYQHVASPYPQRANYGRTTRVSPQMGVMPPHLENISTVSTEPGPQLDTSRISTPESSGRTLQGVETKKAVVDVHVYPLTPTADPSAEPKQAGLALRAGITPFTCALTVLKPFVKPKSPRPTFKATEPSRSPKPMFDVPQIRMYTASTSYYESTKVPPVYDSAGLTAIGTETPPKRPAAAKRESAPLLGREPQKVPSLEVNSQLKETTEKSPADVEQIAPPTEIKPKTPGYELQAFRAERPKTPVKSFSRALTPVFEISRANPLLFAVSPVPVEAERAKTSPDVPQTVAELQSSEAEPHGNNGSDMLPAAAPMHESLTEPKPDPTGVEEPTPPAGPQKLSKAQTTTPEPTTLPATSHGCQRPRTPTSEATRLMTTSPGYKRPKTPTYRESSPGVSPVAFQRSKTSTEGAQKSKSGYRGLTPAEYAAHGGIKTFFPAFGFSTSQVQVKDEIKNTPEEATGRQTTGEETIMEERSWGKTSTFEELLRDKVNLDDETGGPQPLVPTIVITREASGTSTKEVGAASTQETSLFYEASKAPAQKEKAFIQVETSPPKATPDVKAAAAKSNEQEALKVLPRAGGGPVGRSREQETDPVLEKGKDPEAGVVSAVSGSSAAAQAPGSDGENASTVPAEERSTSEAPPKSAGTQRSKGLKAKVSGWSRLKKHMVVEQEEPKFPESDGHTEATQLDPRGQAEAGGGDGGTSSDADAAPTQTSSAAKATKMWDAVLFQMFATEENIMHQIELNQSENQPKEEKKEEIKEIPSFVYKLPVLLFSPKFDAKKLKKAASRPVTKIATVFEMGLIGRKGRDEEPKDFNRTARGFATAPGTGTQMDPC